MLSTETAAEVPTALLLPTQMPRTLHKKKIIHRGLSDISTVIFHSKMSRDSLASVGTTLPI